MNGLLLYFKLMREGMLMTNKRVQRIEEVANLAYKYEQEYGGCAQCVLAAFKEVFVFVDEGTFKAATGLCGGLGLTGDTCGALLGASMAVSLCSAREFNNMEDLERIRYGAFTMVRELCQRFKDEYGTTHCHEIHKKLMGRSFNLWDEEDKKEFEKAGAHDDKCPSVCANAARWAAELLLERNLI